jgi:hypothetical protein
MDELVEKVARALFDSFNDNPPPDFPLDQRVLFERKDWWCKQARAAIEAMGVHWQASVAVRAMVDAQAEDDGLWFIAETAAEAYLQQELRKLHAAIEAMQAHQPAYIVETGAIGEPLKITPGDIVRIPFEPRELTEAMIARGEEVLDSRYDVESGKATLREIASDVWHAMNDVATHSQKSTSGGV